MGRAPAELTGHQLASQRGWKARHGHRDLVFYNSQFNSWRDIKLASFLIYLFC